MDFSTGNIFPLTSAEVPQKKKKPLEILFGGIDCYGGRGQINEKAHSDSIKMGIVSQKITL